MPTDQDMVEAYNEAAEVLNKAQSRSFDGSTTFVALCVILAIIIAIFSGQWGILVMLVPVAIYWYATRKPTFLMMAADFKGKKPNAGLIAAILGSGAVGLASGNKPTSDTIVGWLVSIMFFILACVLIPLVTLVNYLRNYVFYK